MRRYIFCTGGVLSSVGKGVTAAAIGLVGGALGTGLSGFVLASTGFNAALGGAQSSQAILRIRIFFFALPIAGLLVALIALSRYDLSRDRMAVIRSKLEASRGKV